MYQNLRKLRESLEMTQTDFGKSIGVAKTTYSNYESGTREPNSDFWILIADKYGVTVDFLVGRTSEPHSFFGYKKTAPAPGEPDTGDAALNQLKSNYDDMNDEGRERLVEISDDMIAGGRYKKPNQSYVGKEA